MVARVVAQYEHNTGTPHQLSSHSLEREQKPGGYAILLGHIGCLSYHSLQETCHYRQMLRLSWVGSKLGPDSMVQNTLILY
jgi:hypothetical protein